MPEIAKDLVNYSKENSLKDIPPSGIRYFDVKVNKIPDILKLTLGEPDLNTPEHVKKAAVQSILDNDSHYSDQEGTLRLRTAISNFLKRKLDLSYDPQTEVLVTIGGTEALTATMLTFFHPGDDIIVPTPSYALYFPIIHLTGSNLVSVNTAPTNFVLTPEVLEETLAAHPQAKAIILNYPTNPTGREYSAEELEKLAAIIKEHNLMVISDEIYSELVYDLPHTSIAQYLPERTIIVNGLSKSHAMTGYRAGYLAGPAGLVKWVMEMHAFLVTAPSNPAQAAATEALENGDQDPVEASKIYQKRRDYITKALNDLGLETVPSNGAFYIFVKIPAKYGTDDWAFAEDLAQKGKVAGIPGSSFGAGGEGYIRFSYAASDEKLEEAVRRIKDFLTKEVNQ
ncbi:aminotransferase class I/II-fold pyridoxal phosphate-dependent enzyme [Xylocopilactobacillus apicola]|uniref:Aminotransferase n=1 Tax=Xylocopilactobacillus apicola TaxID=2932184 RepID=A0AAU9D5K5_9LACO|nr:aminotransferase class I/II-fold pyridoxal phosphate-dependent enzyme [Xylocopilactobacillus apicola]BDR59079.1 aminotransferase [Xylocopilactobacillus apicola]